MSVFYIKYFPDLPEGESLKHCTRHGNIHIAEKSYGLSNGVAYGPSRETGFFVSLDVPDTVYTLYTYNVSSEVLNDKPVVNTGLSLPDINKPTDGGGWSYRVHPTAMVFTTNDDLVNYYNQTYSTNLNIDQVKTAISSNPDLYLRGNI